MTYVHYTRSPGIGLAEYEKVQHELGPAPIAGHRSHHVGVVDGALVVVDVWESRTDADRFAAERLFPAFEKVGIRPDASGDITAFEAMPTGVPA